MGLLSTNNENELVLNNDLGYTTQLPGPTESGIGAKLKDMWGACSDQIMTSVSPATSVEFGFEYEKEFAKLFGLFGYGCCERLDHKIDDVREAFPNLRKVSVSPWSKPEPFFEKVRGEVVCCWKPNSTYLSQPDFEGIKDFYRDELKNVLIAAQKYNINLVVNMKTIITLNGEPERLWWYCDMARKMIDDFYN